ncbi:MAG TPA: hypothetical protein VI893_07515, partial [Thermoplasmata archaeon]|nr:hypothetical protein [Thermoplasmata archaeon]
MSAGGHSRLEPEWLVSLGGLGADETALTVSLAADGTLLAAGTNSSAASTGGFRISVDPATGREISRQLDAAPTVSLAPNQRGFLGGERRNTSGFVMAMYIGNDSRTPEWWNLYREPADRLDRVAALGGGWTAMAGFINDSGVVQVHNFNGHLEWIVYPRVGDSGFRSIGVAHDGAGGLLLAGSSRTNSSSGYGNLFVERYGRDGEKIWGGEWDSGRPTAVVTSMTALPDGTSYVTGWATKGGLARPHVPFASQFSPDGDETWSQLLALDPTKTDAEA